VLAAIRSARVDEILVVVAPEMDELARIASAAHAHVLRLAADTPDMRATCLHGLAWIEDRFHLEPDDGWLLLPADHPTVRPNVVLALVAAAQEDAEKTIVVPTHAGRRGHPTWLAWSHVDAIRALPPHQGLNAYIRTQSLHTRELSWPSDEILRDLNTPEDYQRLL